MVTAKTQYNLKNAEEYFEEHLAVGDYYDEGQRIAGEWIGLGAQRLDLSGKVRADDFLSLCENQHPATGDTLTQRLNTTRTEGGESTANRRIFFDFTFSPPKSVSIAGLLGEDKRISEAHARAVRSALGEFEAFAATRVRAGGAQSDRLTGNFVAALFTHDTSRALDPHLHTHCIVFNATFDAVENRWKAMQNYELLRARKFAENCELLAIRFAIVGGVILKSKVSPKNCVNGFPSGIHRLTEHLPSCSRINRNSLAEISRICARNWPLRSDLENRNP
jgi:conjugative relaxase-like TrwC/TraI family protein